MTGYQMGESTMIKKVKSEDLQVGMYVMLGQSWLRHSFLKPNFRITSDKQIKKILHDGIKEVKVDTSKSEVIEERDLYRDMLGPRGEDVRNTQTGIPLPEPDEFNPIDEISEELHRTIQNTRIPPKTKAKEVYNHSLRMMTNVLDDPRAENILSGKKMVYDIVDHILADDETAECMALITSHDYYTYTHSVNVGILSVLMSKSVFKGSYDHDMRELGAGFFLHDLGKCDIPNDVINKAGRLSDEEWQQMRNHPRKGNKILVDTNQLTKECGVIVMQHHEREDGSGYPFGFAEDKIHPYARICSIADVYDALTSTRAYKKKVPTYEALRIMKEEMIQFFNRDIFKQFVMIFKE
ncbi:HD-GYP domain-containing protein [Candidatus Neomarinimicrobiota bacterium]